VLFIYEYFIAVSAVCGCSSEPSVLTARSVGLRTSSMAQVGISFGNKMSPQQVLSYLRAATSIAEVGKEGGGACRENHEL